MVEKAVGQAVRPGRLHEALLNIELHQGDALDEIPGDHIRQHGVRLRVILPHDKPHLRGLSPSAGAAHALQKARDGEGRVHMKGALEPADVDAQLQRRRGADGEKGIIVLHVLLRALPVGGREVAVVDEKAVRLMPRLAVLPELLADSLTFLPGIGENEALFTPCVRKDVADAGVCRRGCGVGGRLRHRGRGILPALVGLGVCVEKMLHAEPPDLLPALKAGDHGAAPAPRREKAPSGLRVADGGGETHPPGPAARGFAEAFNQAEGLHPPVPPEKGVYLVNDDEAQIPEKGRDLHVLVDHQRFQGLRRDLQNAVRLSEKLLRLRHVPVPAVNGDARLLTELVQAPELVIDEGLEGRNIQDAHAVGRLLVQKRQDGEKGRLRLARGGGSREQYVFLRAENGLHRRVLDAAQHLPAGAVDIVLDKGRVAVKNVHIVNSAKASPASSDTASDLA